MKDVAFIIQGQTFLKSIGPLLYFSNKAGIRPSVFILKERAGKPYDNVDLNTVQKILDNSPDNRAYILNSTSHIKDSLRNLGFDHFVCQDAQYHAKDICAKFRSFSIGVFFDTLHNAKRLSEEEALSPHKIYFPSDFFKSEYEKIIGKSCVGETFGSTHLDHAIFIEKKERKKKSVLFLTPIQKTIPEHIIEEIEDLIFTCRDLDIEFHMKDRVKSPWIFKDKSARNNITIHSSESGMPYSSLSLILNTDVHITSYGTSVCEATFFGKPSVNIDVDPNGNLTNEIKWLKNEYDIKDIFNSDLCKTVQSGILQATIEQMTKTGSPKINLTYENNSSLLILEDIKKNV